MGKFEQEYFAKHFKSLKRLYAFRKMFNKWSQGEKGIWMEFNHHTMQWIQSNITDKKILVDEHYNPTKWIYLTKNKVDVEIKRREKMVNNQ